MNAIGKYLSWMSTIVFLYFILLEVRGCKERPTHFIRKDTIQSTKIIERPVFIRDTIKIKSVAWKFKDSLIYVETGELPCNDTSFIAQADSVITNTGDTLNLAFSYHDRKGNFSLVFKPRPDSVLIKTIEIPITEPNKLSDFGALLGTFGLGLLIGVGAVLSR